MFQDAKKNELKRLRAELAATTDSYARSDLQRKIAFVEAVIRMRDGVDSAREPE